MKLEAMLDRGANLERSRMSVLAEGLSVGSRGQGS
jgi:hypothetical protein